MAGENGQRTYSQPGRCVGHCRAQRHDMDFHFDDSYEKEKASIKAYEDGWDEWDGPVWPWRHTNLPQNDDEYSGCCTPPETPLETPLQTPSETPAEEKKNPLAAPTSATKTA